MRNSLFAPEEIADEFCGAADAENGGVDAEIVFCSGAPFVEGEEIVVVGSLPVDTVDLALGFSFADAFALCHLFDAQFERRADEDIRAVISLST